MQGETAEIRNYCHQLKSLWAYRQAHNLKVEGAKPTPRNQRLTRNINVLRGFMLKIPLMQLSHSTLPKTQYRLN